MPRPTHRTINLRDPPGVDVNAGHPPWPAPNWEPHVESNFVDVSGPLFSMYLERAGEEDKKMTDSWKADADGILIFTGLFSAAVATLVAVSVQDLRPSSQDISAFYLANIYQLLADSNGTHILIPSILPDPSTPFSPPIHAVWVNSLWFLSLVIGLTCALLATLLQQWARRYMKVTQPRYNPHRRVQIRAFFAEGVDKLHLPWAVEALPILLHLSLFLFFAGLAIFLFNINHTVFKAVISWLGVCASLYMCITFMPIFRHDSPYYAPLSSSAWLLYSGTLSLVFRTFRWIVWSDYLTQCFSASSWKRVGALQRTYDRWALQGLTKTAEEMVGTVSSEMVGRALKWTFESLYEDRELEQFFASIPGFCSSKVVDDTQRSLARLDSWTSAQALEVFLDHTWSSSLVSEAVKQRRLVICVRAADAARLYYASKWILRGVFSGHFHGALQSVEMGRALRSKASSTASESGLCAQSIVASIIASVRSRDSDWFALAMDQLGVSEAVLRDYVSHGDSVLLANLIHIARQIFLSANRDLVPEPHSILRSVSQFDVRNALPELQRDFCALWNEIILEVQTKGAYTPILILVHTRHIYSVLHQGADAATPAAFLTSTDDADDILYQPFSYPLCNNPGHWSCLPPQIHEPVHAITSKSAHAPATPPPAILRHRDAVGDVITTKPLPNILSFPAITSSCPSLKQYDLNHATVSEKHGTADTSISSMIHPASALQRDEETRIIPLPVVPNSTLSPLPTPALCSAVPAELHPPGVVVVTGSDSVPQRPSSFSAAVSLPSTIASQFTSAFDQNVPMSVGCLDVLAPDDTRILKSPISIEVPRHSHQSPLVPGITANKLQSEDRGPSENLTCG